MVVAVVVDVVGGLASEVSPGAVFCVECRVPVKKVQEDPTPELRYDSQKRARLVRPEEEDARMVHCCCTSAA